MAHVSTAGQWWELHSRTYSYRCISTTRWVVAEILTGRGPKMQFPPLVQFNSCQNSSSVTISRRRQRTRMDKVFEDQTCLNCVKYKSLCFIQHVWIFNTSTASCDDLVDTTPLKGDTGNREVDQRRNHKIQHPWLPLRTKLIKLILLSYRVCGQSVFSSDC